MKYNDTSNFLPILKGVSRSFYLTIRILPPKIREPITLAYLLARAADTIADTEIISAEHRLEDLLQFRDQLQNPKAAKTHVENLIQKLQEHPHAWEKKLLEALPEIFQAYERSPQKAIIEKVLMTLTQGMKEDLEYFPKQKTKITFLKQTQDTEKYTYLVAGCVGEFWTEILYTSYLTGNHKREMIDDGVTFGKGLQMINILRDLPRDLQQGRCYLSEEDLQYYEIPKEDFPNVPDPQLQKLYSEKIQSTRKLLQSGFHYFQRIPTRFLRLRVAVLWPLFIGLDTLRAMEGAKPWQTAVKINRNAVYKMIFFTLCCFGLNGPIEWYYRQKGGFAHEPV